MMEPIGTATCGRLGEFLMAGVFPRDKRELEKPARR